MNSLVKISPKTRKKISLFLFLNFLSYTILLAFPQKECDGSCEMAVSSKHDCCSTKPESENDCCSNMPELVQISHVNKELNFKNTSCEYKLDIHENSFYIISQKEDLKVSSSSQNPLELLSELQKPKYFRVSTSFITDTGPPIYIRTANLII